MSHYSSICNTSGKRCLLFCIAFSSGLLPLFPAQAEVPAWWIKRGVLTSADVNDYALVNQGQLKHIVTQAYSELQDRLPGGAGSEIDGLISSWVSPGGPTDDYAVMNLGQLKSVAKLFYDRLHAAGYQGAPLEGNAVYPWTGNGVSDYSYANIGQLKYLFSFDFILDSDRDGIGDAEESNYGTDPDNADSDGDDLLDGWEIQYGLDPNLADGHLDLDGDDVPNREDARPNDASIGRMTVVINEPANGSVIP